MGNIIAFVVTLLMAIGAIVYIVRAKRRGAKCIGCPNGCSTASEKCDGSSCASCCGCQNHHT